MNKNLSVEFASAGPKEPGSEEDDVRISTISSREWIYIEGKEHGVRLPVKLEDLKNAINAIENFQIDDAQKTKNSNDCHCGSGFCKDGTA